MRHGSPPAMIEPGYDAVAVTLHWLTVLFVLTQFALGELWGFAPRPVRHVMVATHMSVGILLGLVVLFRIVWRLLPGHRVRPAVSGWMEVASKAVHSLLYALLVAEAVLGFTLRWSGGEEMSFFGLQIPSPFAAFSKPAHDLVGRVHELVGWTIIVLAAGHALAALMHHFVLRDDVLRRMLPDRFARLREPPAMQPGVLSAP